VAVVPAGAGDRAAPGDVRLRSLMRSQLRSALFFFTVLAVPTALLPLILTSASGPLSGSALAWIILGFCGYPPLVLLAWLYVRRAEHHERDFARLMAGASPKATE
jgi:hypothetical protein